MKGQVAASAVAMASLAREGFKPGGDLIFVAAADEEVGVDFGLSWLCKEHPEAVRAEYSLNEGAGDRVVIGGRPFYLASTAEKMSSPFMLRVHGRSGHASMPGIADNALVKAARLIQPLAEFTPEPRLEPEVAALFEAVVGAPPEDAEPGARGRSCGRSARGRARRAAGRHDLLADDDQRVAEAQRDPGAVRGDRRLPAPARADAGRGGGGRARAARRRGLRARVGRGLRRHPLADGGAALGRDRFLGRRDGARSECRADLSRRLHRQPLAARRVRHGRLRLLPHAVHGPAGRDAARPLGRRAGPGRRSRARSRVPALCGAGHEASLRACPKSRSVSAAWRSRTACSCTGRTPGRARFAFRTGGSRSHPTSSVTAPRGSRTRSCEGRRGSPRRLRFYRRSGAACPERSFPSNGLGF